MNRVIAIILTLILCILSLHLVAFADSKDMSDSRLEAVKKELVAKISGQSFVSGSQPIESVSYQYNKNGSIDSITIETSYPDGTQKATVTILDPVLQLPISEDTIISSCDGSRETVNVTYTRDAYGTILEKLTVTIEQDGSELKDLIVNNSFGSNTHRKTECFDKTGNLIMSEEVYYYYNEKNILERSVQASFQQNGHDIKTIITYDPSGEIPIASTSDYNFTDGTSVSTMTCSLDNQDASLENELLQEFPVISFEADSLEEDNIEDLSISSIDEISSEECDIDVISPTSTETQDAS